jgi:hypothetical protein
METKRNWIFLFIIFPIAPLLLRGLVKFALGHLNLDTINSSELFFVLALICLYVSQELRNSELLLENIQKRREKSNRITLLLCLCGTSIFFSAASEFLHVEIVLENYMLHLKAYNFFAIVSYIGSFFILNLAYDTQNEFHLVSKFI